MPNWTDKSLEELRSSSKDQIISAVAQYLDERMKKQIVEMLMDAEVFYRHPTVVKRSDGQIEYLGVENEDSLGNKTGNVVMTFSYFDTDEIHDIIISIRDADDIEIQRWRIQHFRDGSQPVIEDIT